MPGSKFLYNHSRAIAYRLPRPPASSAWETTSAAPLPFPPSPSTIMVAPFLLQNSSQVSLPPGDGNHAMKSKVSLSTLANAMRKGEFPHHSYTSLPKNYTKSYGPCTLSLNADHEASSGLPIFSNGAVISGSLEISKISKLLQSIQMMVRMPTSVWDRLSPSLTGDREDHYSRPWGRWIRREHHVLPRLLRMEPRIQLVPSADVNSHLIPTSLKIYRPRHRSRASNAANL